MKGFQKGRFSKIILKDSNVNLYDPIGIFTLVL